MSRTAAPSKQAAPSLCVVGIGYGVNLLMPIEEGLKLVKLMESASVLEYQRDTGSIARGGPTWAFPRGSPDVRLEKLKPGDIAEPDPTDPPARPLPKALGYSPLKLQYSPQGRG